MDFKIEEKNSKCRKILSSVKCALRGSFRKCGFRRLVGPVHEGVHILQVAGSGAGDGSSRDLESSTRG